MLVLVLALTVLGAAAWWQAIRRLRDIERQVAELRLVRRELQGARDELGRGLAVTRTHLAAVAAGEPPPQDVIVRGTAWQDIPAAEALRRWQETPDLFVLDVRTPAEWAHGHIPRARLIPLDELEDRLTELPARDVPILVHCAAGARSAQACGTLAERGFTRILNLAGGLHAWTGPREQEEAPPPPAGALAGTTVVYHGGPVSETQVIAAIRDCYDPEIPLNVYDLGLVYGVEIAESGINVRMTLTSEACPSARAIPEDVKQHIVALGQPNVQVELVWDPPWHPSRISEQGKEKLGLS